MSTTSKVIAQPVEIVQPPKRKKHRIRRFFARIIKLTLALVVLSELAAISFIWISPPLTAFMIEGGEPLAYQYVSIDHMSRYVLAATIAHEDEQLGTRRGAFDMADFNARVDAYLHGRPDPSGSTIPQQLAKNIFLWPDQSAFRKALEAGLSTELAFTLTPKRELELYLNFAQFGPKLFGICAATWYYFNTPPSKMTERQAASLMGVLPAPDLVRRSKDGGFLLDSGGSHVVTELINGAANVWVPKQIEGMGGWQKAVATVGIADTAADHESTVGKPDGCSTMPLGVMKRLVQDGFVS